MTDIGCEHCGEPLQDEEDTYTIENPYTHEMLTVCGGCFRQLR